MIQSFINYVKPYTQLGSIAGKLSAIGVMGYGIKQLWSKEAVEKESLLTRMSLSSLYLLHMGSVSLTMAVLFGGLDVPAPVATAIVSTTALIKGSAELLKEYLDNAELKKQHNSLQNQLQIKTSDFQRLLTIFEDFKESETEILLLEEELAEIKTQYARNGRQRQAVLDEKWQYLKTYIQEKRNKNTVVTAFFEKKNIETFDVVLALREINEKIAQLLHNPSGTGKEEKELKNLAILNHQCIKFKKVKDTIAKLEEMKKDKAENSKISNAYIHFFIKELKQKLNDWKKPRNNHDYISDSEITDRNIESFLKGNETKAKFLRVQYNKLERDIEAKIDKLKFEFKQKQNQFKVINNNAIKDFDIDFTSMFNDMKAIIDLQNQISLAEFNESSKKKNVNFGTITSLTALLMCITPSGDLAKFMNPLMLTIGLMAGASSSWDFYKKYLLKQIILSTEDKKLKRYIQDKSFHALASINNVELRERLIEKLNAVLEGKNDVEQKQALKPIRTAKEKAKTLIIAKHKTRGKSKTNLVKVSPQLPLSSRIKRVESK
jgi:hypothetical protein